MPYSGIEPGSTLERKMESCVAQVLADHKGDKGFKKSNAVAICRSKLEGALVLEPVTAEELCEYGNHALFAKTAPGALLRFKNAHLCSAGENKNRDWIDEAGIEELAATMSFRAIDDEHDPVKVTGFFVNPRGEDDSTKLITDGIFFADRFPEIVAQVQSGAKKLSIEAGAQRAVCSVCGGEYTSVRDYCDHLKDKVAHGAVRKLYGLKAKGGATVFHPAWDTSFDANGFVMIASQVEFEPKEDEVLSFWAKLESKLDAYLQKLKPVLITEELENDQTKGGATMSEVNVAELNLEELGLVQASELETQKVDLEAQLAEKDVAIEKLNIGFARVLEMGLTASDIEIMANLSEDAYALFQKQRLESSEEEAEEETTVQAGEEATQETQTQTTVLEGADTVTTVPLTWETAGPILKLKEV